MDKFPTGRPNLRYNLEFLLSLHKLYTEEAKRALKEGRLKDAVALEAQRTRIGARIKFDFGIDALPAKNISSPPRLGERILLLVLRTKEERANIPGDLEEEFKEIAVKHGARYAKLWYYKQVAASAWPLIRKAVGWGLLASVGGWIRGRM